jgi:glyoxylase-like metal-dependent hydrolase (beta-lactamase superfamily II)
MAEQIQPNLFRIEIPLPENPLKFLNSYVITSPDRNLIIDTGFNRKECLDAMTGGLNELGVDLANTDFFITHLHADHFGLVAELSTERNNIYFNRPDAEIIWAWEGFEPMIQYAVQSGFPEDEVRAALQNHPANKYNASRIPELKILTDGDTINIGDYQFSCIETPGHTRGHMCLYEPRKKILISGDHILYDITPNIQCWSDELNPLENYLASLEKVYHLDVELTLPGHRSLFSNYKQRIAELKHHHQNRVQEVLSILESGSKSAHQIAPDMTWDIIHESWEQFPLTQKWFAIGETIAHLRYLEEKEKIYRKILNGQIVYSLVS